MVTISISVPKELISKPGQEQEQKGVGEPESIEISVKAFIFDKDGTLLTHDHFVPIMEKRVQILSEHYQLSNEDKNVLTRILGLDPDTHKIIPQGTMFIARADTQLLVEAFLSEGGFSGLNGSDVKSRVAEVFQEVDRLLDFENYVRPLPGVAEFLEQLKSRGVNIAIATHDSSKAAKDHLAAAGIDKYIDLVIGLDFSENILHKPSPSMLLTACKKFRIEPSEAIVVGDSVSDVLMGKRGGAGLSVASLSGEHNKKDFKDHTYDAMVNSVADVKII